MEWIILSIYVIGVVASALIFPKVFPYKEGEWEFEGGEAYPIDEVSHKIKIEGMCFLWPLVIAFMVLMLPIKAVEYLTDLSAK